MGCETTHQLENENSLRSGMKLGRKKLSGNYLTVPLEYHVTVPAHRTRWWNRYQPCAGGGGGGGGGDAERIVVRQAGGGEQFYQMGTPIKKGNFWKMEN
jgi:hypothetical protein